MLKPSPLSSLLIPVQVISVLGKYIHKAVRIMLAFRQTIRRETTHKNYTKELQHVNFSISNSERFLNFKTTSFEVFRLLSSNLRYSGLLELFLEFDQCIMNFRLTLVYLLYLVIQDHARCRKRCQFSYKMKDSDS